MTGSVRIAEDVLTPASADDRLPALDVIRGIALAFMILVHFHQLLRAEGSGGVHELVGWGVWVLVEQKAWGVFAILFGVGLALLARRLEARGDRVALTLVRRLVALLAVGLLVRHTIHFSILEIYAWWGLALVAIRRWSTRALLAAAVASAMARPVVVAGWGVLAGWAGASSASPATSPAFEWLLPDTNLALMIVGLLAVRLGVVDEPLRHRRLVLAWMLGGAAAWAVSWLVLYHVPARLPIQATYWAARTVAGLVQDQWLAFTYAGGLLLLLAARPHLVTRLAAFGTAGRMAFTNYVLQATLMWHLSARLGVKLRELEYVAAWVVLFASIVAASHAWMAHFRYGPLEWLWRMATYARPEPLRRPRAVSRPAVIA